MPVLWPAFGICSSVLGLIWGENLVVFGSLEGLEGVWAPFQVGGDLGVAARQPKTTTRHSKIVFF